MDYGKMLDRWLDEHGVQDKDSSGAARDRRAEIEESARIRLLKPQAALDLHGKTVSEAEGLMEEFLRTSQDRGLEKVLIIHGKGIHSAGNHVMTDAVHRILRSSPAAGSFGRAERDQGGSGATWARIRPKKIHFSR